MSDNFQDFFQLFVWGFMGACSACWMVWAFVKFWDALRVGAGDGA